MIKIPKKIKQNDFTLKTDSFEGCDTINIGVKLLKNDIEIGIMHIYLIEDITYRDVDDMQIDFDCIDYPLYNSVNKIFTEDENGITEYTKTVDKILKRISSFGENLYYISEIKIIEKYRGMGYGKVLLDMIIPILAKDENGLIITYPYCIQDYNETDHRKIVNFWNKNNFHPMYITNPMFYYDRTSKKRYDSSLFNKLKYKDS